MLKHSREIGRSMIEMLGVLAIIAVLSVGGISGYSKAMEKFKVNKAISEYSYLIFGLLQNLDYIQGLNAANDNGAANAGIVDFVQATNLVPDTWKKVLARRMLDPYGNIIQLFSRNNRLVIDFYLGGAMDENGNLTVNTHFSYQLCQNLMTDLVQPLHYSLYYVGFTQKWATKYYGDQLCNSEVSCLSGLNLTEINELCRSCTEGKMCAIVLEF